VGFDPDPALACHDRDRPREYHWQPSKKGTKIDEYLGMFSLNKRDFGLFWHDGEAIGDNKRGYSCMVGRERGSFRKLPEREKTGKKLHPTRHKCPHILKPCRDNNTGINSQDREDENEIEDGAQEAAEICESCDKNHTEERNFCHIGQ
jgi:hypothetical protein